PELKDKMDRLATKLAEWGVEKGDRVATIMPSSLQFIIADYGISKAGGVNIPNDFLEAEEDLAYRLEKGEPTVLIATDDHREGALAFAQRNEPAFEGR
ncbi:MAG: AMP-binding protein, partial [Halobacteria archaeon]|nr:AMP-binding protein [Halobacteria archaeon]